MADKKTLSEKEIGSKIKDLKIELLKNPTKKGSIKREIARMLTMKKDQPLAVSREPLVKDGGNKKKTLTKSVEDTK